jgi:hypothetical protein
MKPPCLSVHIWSCVCPLAITARKDLFEKNVRVLPRAILERDRAVQVDTESVRRSHSATFTRVPAILGAEGLVLLLRAVGINVQTWKSVSRKAQADQSQCADIDARIAFNTQKDMLLGMHFVASRLKIVGTYLSTPPKVMHDIEFDLQHIFEQVIDAYLKKFASFRHLPRKLVLLLIMWGDGAQIQTAIKMEFLDPTGKLIPGFISGVHKLFGADISEHQIALVSC